MHATSRFLVLTGLLLGGCLASAAAEEAQTAPLFRIERSKNANVVQYDVQLRPDGRLDPKEPVVAYWIRLAKDGQRKELSWVQHRFAYGFDTRHDRDTGVATLRMKAGLDREIRVVPGEEGYRAELLIDGRPAYVDRIFIQSIEGGVLPEVEYIDFWGTDVEPKEPRYERRGPS
jgi:hypothetical protein